MKKIIILNVIILLSAVMVNAQKSKTTTPVKTPATTMVAKSAEEPKLPEVQERLIGHFATKYSLATRWNDLEVAKSALYDLIVQYPGSDSLIFALAISYYENQKFASSVLIGQDLLARNPKSIPVLELVGAAYESLRVNDRALQNYESLYLLTSSSDVLYKMAFLQYELKKYPECITNSDILLGKPEAETTKLTFNDAAGKPKEYAMKIALLNLKGMVYKEQGDKVNAKKFFDQTLTAAPDFVPAKENLVALAK